MIILGSWACGYRECVLNGCGFDISAGLSAVWSCCAVADVGPSHSRACSLVHLGVVAAPIISVSFLRVVSFSGDRFLIMGMGI